MSESEIRDGIDYPELMQEAVWGMLRKLLARVAEYGLPGNHHFYLTFRTGDPGVELDEILRVSYPEEMTVVIQHQFWDLEAGDDALAVTLAFGGGRHHLRIPYAALTRFVDPSANFALGFASPEDEEDGLESERAEIVEEANVEVSRAQVLSFDRSRKREE